MDVDRTESPPASRGQETGQLNAQEPTRSAEPSLTHQKSSCAERDWRQSPDHLSNVSDIEEAETGGMCHDVDEGAEEPGVANALGPESDELADVFETLTVGFGGVFPDLEGDGNLRALNYPKDLDF
jgi:hypothetical protein